jgi:hypothetical protein
MAGRKSLGHQDPKTSGLSGTESGRAVQDGLPDRGRPGRGSSNQGPKQDARGGPQGANQGGASRGGSRVEPSHAHDRVRKDKALRPKKR